MQHEEKMNHKNFLPDGQEDGIGKTSGVDIMEDGTHQTIQQYTFYYYGSDFCRSSGLWPPDEPEMPENRTYALFFWYLSGCRRIL